MSLIKVAYWGHDYEGHGAHGAALGGGLGALGGGIGGYMVSGKVANPLVEHAMEGLSAMREHGLGTSDIDKAKKMIKSTGRWGKIGATAAGAVGLGLLGSGLGAVVGGNIRTKKYDNR